MTKSRNLTLSGGLPPALFPIACREGRCRFSDRGILTSCPLSLLPGLDLTLHLQNCSDSEVEPG
ncbi:hypothetical protein JG688_00011769 [Phytophthora aleatoria]|uniref:Uncharacterized protein n=1 Tax=Phytophthora aleatoria TaxID=2496075 RepID=A0A8J5J037_9STRA|nr:hypothetical protein JG688_00011769 [Phytophthora aleatoria]